MDDAIAGIDYCSRCGACCAAFRAYFADGTRKLKCDELRASIGLSALVPLGLPKAA